MPPGFFKQYSWAQCTQEWHDRKLKAQLAQSKFLGNNFKNIAVAKVNSPQYIFVLAAERLEQLGNNVAFSFPQMCGSEPSVASFAEPISLCMAVAARYLRENERMTPQQI